MASLLPDVVVADLAPALQQPLGERPHLIDSGPDEGAELVLCRVEGCPRIAPDGQDEECGLSRLHLLRTGTRAGSPEPPECGAVATVDLWIDLGLLDLPT